jgi:hypothetical protein
MASACSAIDSAFIIAGVDFIPVSVWGVREEKLGVLLGDRLRA